MPDPTPREIKEFIRNLNLTACARCGRARGGDQATVNAIQSCAIEDPRINDYLCGCPCLTP